MTVIEARDLLLSVKAKRKGIEKDTKDKIKEIQIRKSETKKEED